MLKVHLDCGQWIFLLYETLRLRLMKVHAVFYLIALVRFENLGLRLIVDTFVTRDIKVKIDTGCLSVYYCHMIKLSICGIRSLLTTINMGEWRVHIKCLIKRLREVM
ncbi:hypothetical protein HanIR_Chr14g0712171 [Helianthus annuus]|nr:hypothetical protein HanIR_Chr14g0712171 [Helianthus annuus]